MMKATEYRILVVDDERDICRALEFLLSREGYKVATAYSGQDALKKIETEEFDLVITDLKMEGVTGMEVLERAVVHATEPDRGHYDSVWFCRVSCRGDEKRRR